MKDIIKASQPGKIEFWVDTYTIDDFLKMITLEKIQNDQHSQQTVIDLTAALYKTMKLLDAALNVKSMR